MQLPYDGALFLELALDDAEHDRVLVVEIPVHQAGTHLRGLGDVRHARRVETVLDEALQGGAQDAVALDDRARGRSRAGRRVHGVTSSQPPPSTLYSTTRFDCSASRVEIS